MNGWEDQREEKSRDKSYNKTQSTIRDTDAHKCQTDNLENWSRGRLWVDQRKMNIRES